MTKYNLVNSHQLLELVIVKDSIKLTRNDWILWYINTEIINSV